MTQAGTKYLYRMDRVHIFSLPQEGNRLVQEEYLGRVYSAILAHPALQELGHSVPALLVNHAKAVLLMHRFGRHCIYLRWSVLYPPIVFSIYSFQRHPSS